MDANFFLKPKNSMQKRYEALRAAFVDCKTTKEIADEYGYTFFSFKSLRRDAKNLTADHFFNSLKKGPKTYHDKTLSAYDRIIELRKKNYSINEIHEKLKAEEINICPDIINKILKKEGFTKLFRRTSRERLETLQSDKIYPEASDVKAFGINSSYTSRFGGIFLFLPIIHELKLEKLFEIEELYGSNKIPPLSYILSYLALKLLGKERLSYVDDFSFDYGLGVFAGLNVLPKATAIGSYSYHHPRTITKKLLKGFMKLLKTHGYLKGQNINLDFHSIPYFGDKAELNKNWVPTRGKCMKSILSFFAQDLDTTFLCYSNGEINHEEINDEVLSFVDFYKTTNGIYPERLIFDSKLTTYANLYELNLKNISFVTLKRRGKNFEKKISSITNWKKITLDNLKRKYRNLEYSESIIKLTNYKGDIRQIIVKGTSRELPMCLITNDLNDSVKNIVTIYTKRWRIENNIQENIDFFNLNAVSSPIVVKVDFDIAFTLIANTMYKIFAKKTKWFKDSKAKTISRNFIEVDTKISINEESVEIKLGKKCFNPVIMDWISSLPEIKISWWNNRILKFKFE